jgi:hypothetical protein
MSVPRCAICTLPNQTGLCKGCATLEEQFGWPFASLEFLCVAGKQDDPEHFIWSWKDYSTHSPADVDDVWLSGVGTGLSAYLETYRERLIPDGTIVTAIPSRAPVIATSMRTVVASGWFAVEPIVTGAKNGHWLQHESTQTERLARSADSWLVDAKQVSGRDVLLLDDVWVTGASASSYVTALHDAGARDVRCLVIVRHLNSRNVDYRDALGIIRRQTEWKWSVQSTKACQPTR